MIMVEFSIVPVGEGSSISAHVARAVQVVDGSGLLYKVTPMGTVIEGDWDDVLGVIKESFYRVLEDCSRVTCSIKIDCRKVDHSRMEEKVNSVEEKVGKHIQR
jgi:uncharacterized protein (TIGR00106 family)